jgi:hypothetical protein
VDVYDVPPSLVYHFDQTCYYYQPMGGAKTWEQSGASTINIIAADDKACGTVVLGGKLDGTLLPMQVLQND